MAEFVFVDKRKLDKPVEQVAQIADVPVAVEKPKIEVYPQTLARCHLYFLKAKQDDIIKAMAAKNASNEL